MTEETDPAAELADFLAALDPDMIFRAIALALAVQSDTTRNHETIMGKAAAFHEFIDPFTDHNAPSIPFEMPPKP